jgi:hypothetical protein
MSSDRRRKKPPVNFRVARSPSPVDDTSVIRALRFRRTATGRIGASTTHIKSRVEEHAGSLTPAPSASEYQTNTLEGAPDLDMEVDTSPLAQEPEQSEKPQTEKPSPVSSICANFAVALLS